MAGSDTVWMTMDLNLIDLVVSTPAGAFNEGIDIEAVVIGRLKAVAIAEVGDRVYSRIPSEPTFPLIRVARVGGVPAVREYLDAPNIQIDVWGGTKAQAHDIAQEARVALLGIEGQPVVVPETLALGFISGVADSLGLTWFPDEETGRERYLFAMIFYCRGL